AEVVCAGGEIAADAVVDLVDTLVAKSVLFRAAGDGKARYRLLDTIAEFGQRKVRGRGHERKLRLRHRAWYAALAARQEAVRPRGMARRPRCRPREPPCRPGVLPVGSAGSGRRGGDGV